MLPLDLTPRAEPETGMRWLVAVLLFASCQCGGGRLRPVDSRLRVVPRSLDFGQQEPGTRTELAVSVANEGSSALTLSWSLRDDVRQAFSTGEPKTTTIEGGETVDVSVTYLAPATLGVDTGTLLFEANSLATPELLVPLAARSSRPCVARSCAEANVECGAFPECGGLVQCGSCGGAAVCVERTCVSAADAGADAGVDGGTDAGGDGGSDAGLDGGSDAGPDAGSGDAGMDAGGPLDGGKLVYITTGLYSAAGFTGGMAGADGQCYVSALFAGLPNPSRFRAVISDSTTSLVQRLPDAGGPWVRLDGQLAFLSPADFATGPRSPLVIDERGNVTTNLVPAWTGVAMPGMVNGESCNDWTTDDGGVRGRAGDITATTSAWLDGAGVGCSGAACTRSCDSLFHLYCIEQ